MQLKDSLLELAPHQYEDLYDDEDLPLEDVRKNALHKMFYIGLILLLVFLLAAVTVKIPLEQHFNFVVKADQQEEIYRFPEIVYANRIFVEPGQKIHINTLLAEITSPEIIDLIISNNASKRNLNNFYAHEILLYQSREKNLTLELKETELLIQRNLHNKRYNEQIKIEDLEQLLFNYDETKRRYDINLQLYKNSGISEWNLKDSEKAKIEAQSKLMMSEEQYSSMDSEIVNNLSTLNLKKELTEQKIIFNHIEQQQKEQLLKDQYDLAHETLLFNYGNFEVKGQSLLLKSSFEGKVSFISNFDKEVPQSGILLKIITNASSFYALAAAPPNRIGYIKANKKAVLKINTFPHYEWGILTGELRNLSLTSDANGMYPFEVKISNTGKIGDLLQIGMTGELVITTDEKTFADLVFAKFYNTKDRYLN